MFAAPLMSLAKNPSSSPASCATGVLDRVRSWLIFLLFLVVAPVGVRAEQLKAGAGRFEVSHAGRMIPVWYYLPEETRPDLPILIVMHGVRRDADRYRDEWAPHARKSGFIVVAPEFSNETFPGSEGYSLGGVGTPEGSERGAFTFIEPVFEATKKATGNRSKRYYLYGHSAGAQFVHRFLYFVPRARVAKAVAANAGWWTFPDPTVEFPYGLRGSSVGEKDLRKILELPLIVLLGTADTDPNHANLRRTPEANAQGPHRFARGQSFFAAGKKQAAAQKVPFRWKLGRAPGVAHSDRGMAPYAVTALFGKPSTSARKAEQ